MQIRYKEGETQAQIDEAKSILEALDTAYPGHPWGVRVYDGGFFIRHLDFPSNWGMNCRGTYASASLMKRDVIMRAGEWLERAGLPRGVGDGEQEIVKVEGVPDKWQPAEYRTQKFIENVVIAEAPLRETPRPQPKQEEKQDGYGLAQT